MSAMLSGFMDRFSGSGDNKQQLEEQMDTLPASGRRTWKCEVCTLDNEASATKCAACESDRPAHSQSQPPPPPMGSIESMGMGVPPPMGSIDSLGGAASRTSSRGGGGGGFVPPTAGASVVASGNLQLPPQRTMDSSPGNLPPQQTLSPQALAQMTPQSRYQSQGSIEGFSPPQGSIKAPSQRSMAQSSIGPAALGQTQTVASGMTASHGRQELPSSDVLGGTQTALPLQSRRQDRLQVPQARPTQPRSQGAQPTPQPTPQPEARTYVNTEMHPGTALHGSLGQSKVLLRVLRAHDLRNTDLGILPGDASDPFVVARLGRKDIKTHVVENALSPVWNTQQYEFTVGDDDPEPRLQLEVFSSNQWHANDSLGRLDIPIRSLTPGEMHTVKEFLDEGDMRREDGKRAQIQVEVQLLGQEQLANPHIMQQGGVAHQQHKQKQQMQLQQQLKQQHLALQEAKQKAGPLVPLPSFKDLGPAALARPEPQVKVAAVGEARRLNEYESAACRLGQYDYSTAAPYYPKQEIVDKRQWKDDPFHGWRRELNRTEHNAPPPALNGTRQAVAIEEDVANEAWRNDPFHGWLHHDVQGRPEFGRENDSNVERLQEAQAGRQLMSLPSFNEAPARRFDDHREYASHAPGIATEPRQRLRAGYVGGKRPGQLRDDAPPEQRWRDDAFFGWLPGRGPPSEEQHKLRRPLENARLARLPSFAEGAPELAGVTGRGVGVLTVWVNAALDLAYSHGSGLRGTPSACVKLRMGGEEKVTATISKDANPRWNTPAMTFEVNSSTDMLQLEVHDLANPRSEDHVHNFFLGRLQIPMQQIMEMMQRSQNATRPLHFREKLEGSQQAQIDFECLYEAFDTEQEYVEKQVRREARIGRDDRMPSHDSRSLGNRPRSGSHRNQVPSMRSFAESENGQLGILSIRIIRAFDLVNTDTGYMGDVSDPYVSLRLESQPEKQKKRTATIDNNLNPVWNTSPFLFPVQHPEDELLLEVWHEDVKTQDDFLGWMKIPLYNIIHGVPNKPIRIDDQLQDVESGRLEVEIGFSPG